MTPEPVADRVCREPAAAPSVTLGDLAALKQHGEALAVEGSGAESLLSAMLLYFVAIAAALAWFGENISTRSAEELGPILLDLAGAAPRRGAGLFERAWSALAPSA